MLQTLPEESAEIIQKYQEKLEKENALIISSKNRYEVNEQLQEFTSMTKEAVDRNKVSYFYPDKHPQSYQNIGKQFNPMTTVKLVTNFN